MRCSAAPYEGRGKYIFASYCHEDAARVYPCIELMARDGCRVWYDEGIIPGDEWQETIADRLAACDVFVAFITEKSLSSHNCRREINFAVQRGKKIVSLFMDDVVLSPGMEMILSSIQGIYRSSFVTTEMFLLKLYENEEIAQCRGERRPDLPVNLYSTPGIDDDKTMTLTVGITQGDMGPKKSFLYILSSGERIELEKNVLSIGRNRENADYAIEGDRTISRRHATIKRIYNKYTVVDNDSLNHTLLNGKVLDPWTENELSDGDTICLGKEMLLFFKEYDEAGAFRMPEHVLETENGIIRIGNDPVSTVNGMTIMNSGRGFYLINTSTDEKLFCNGVQLFYGEKRRLQSEDEIMIGTKIFTWRIVL